MASKGAPYPLRGSFQNALGHPKHSSLYTVIKIPVYHPKHVPERSPGRRSQLAGDLLQESAVLQAMAGSLMENTTALRSERSAAPSHISNSTATPGQSARALTWVLSV